MAMLNIFTNDVFGLVQMTNRINDMPFVPGQVGALVPWEEAGIRTTDFTVENRQNTFTLIPNTDRDAPPFQNKKDPRKVRVFKTAHFPLSDTIAASEIQNIRSFGNETELMTVQEEVDQRLQRMTNSHDATLEHQRMGALQGIILDADGTVVYNLFTEFGIAQQSVDFDLGDSTTVLVAKFTEVRRKIQAGLRALGVPNIRVHAFVGETFWERMVSHPNFVDVYKIFNIVQPGMNPLYSDLRYDGINFGSVTIQVYRNAADITAFLPDAEGVAFPLDVPQMYITRFAPATYMETVNTLGRPRYAKMYPTDNRNVSWTIDTQSNPMSIVTRPLALVKLYTST